MSKLNFSKLIEFFKRKNLYLTFDFNDNPAEVLGGNWERVAGDFALWTTTTQGQGGNTIAAGLPNIQGSIWAMSIGTSGSDWVDGAFRSVAVRPENAMTSSGSSLANQQKVFNAKSYNPIYGNSTTVQPPAIKVYLWRKIYENL